MLPGGTIVKDLGPPIVVRVVTEIYRPRFMLIPYGEWKEALEYTYTIQVYYSEDAIISRCWDTSDYGELVGVEMRPVKVWDRFYDLNADYSSASSIRLADDLKINYSIFPPETNCRTIINYLSRLPITTRLQFVEKEVRNGKVFFSEKLGRATRIKE
jgi:hypothetical protein